MAGCLRHQQTAAAKLDSVPVLAIQESQHQPLTSPGRPHLDEDVSLAATLGREDGLTARQELLEPPCACDVVGVDVGVHHVLQHQPQLPNQLGVSLRLLYDGVDDDGLLGLAVPQEVGVGGGLRVKQLSEYHDGVVGSSYQLAHWLD